MDITDLEYLTICQECGCVFDYVTAISYHKKDNGNQVSICPACKHEYEIRKQLINK